MKKTIALLLTLALCFSLCACGVGNSVAEEKSLSDRAASAVKGQLMVYVSLTYETNGVPSITTYVKEIGTNEYQVTGKVTIRDNYGDTYTGKYDAVATYDVDTDDFDVDYDVGDLYRD